MVSKRQLSQFRGTGCHLRTAEPKKPRTPNPELSARPVRTMHTSYMQGRSFAKNLQEFHRSSSFYAPGVGWESR